MRMFIGNENVYNMENAILGMRLSHQSNSDSFYDYQNSRFVVGPDDLSLMDKLAKSGSSHRKFLRAITVSFRLKLPLYMWHEFDTYKHVVRLSDSTMHNLKKRKLTQNDFAQDIAENTLNYLNLAITAGNDIQGIKNMLPSGYLLESIITTNYETLLNMYQQRKSHRLEEWHVICDWIRGLPLMDMFLEEEEE